MPELSPRTAATPRWPLDDFVVPIGSGLIPTGLVGGVAPTTGRLSCDRLAQLLTDLDALADHRARAWHEMRNGCPDA